MAKRAERCDCAEWRLGGAANLDLCLEACGFDQEPSDSVLAFPDGLCGELQNGRGGSSDQGDDKQETSPPLGRATRPVMPTNPVDPVRR
jgi:hypothetical protein